MQIGFAQATYCRRFPGVMPFIVALITEHAAFFDFVRSVYAARLVVEFYAVWYRSAAYSTLAAVAVVNFIVQRF